MFAAKLRAKWRKWWSRLSGSLIQEVPVHLAVCEFYCRNPNCTPEVWATCELRLRGRLPDLEMKDVPQPEEGRPKPRRAGAWSAVGSEDEPGSIRAVGDDEGWPPQPFPDGSDWPALAEPGSPGRPEVSVERRVRYRRQLADRRWRNEGRSGKDRRKND